MAKAPIDAAIDATELVEAVIVRDYWDSDLVRHRAGEVITVTKDELIAGLVSGALTKAD